MNAPARILKLLFMLSVCAGLGWKFPTVILAAGLADQVDEEVSSSADAPQDDTEQRAANPVRTGNLVTIELPVTGKSVLKVQQVLRRLAEQSKNVLPTEERPVVVLEFETSQGKTGQGSALGACVDLARFLNSREMNRLEKVAYIPSPNPSALAIGDEDSEPGRLMGHAVLIALATDKLSLHSNAAIGNAGVDESTIDPFVVETYRNVVSKRLPLDVSVALAMLDKNLPLYQIKSETGTTYTNDPQEAAKREAEIETESIDQLSDAGQGFEVTGDEMAKYGMIRQPVSSRSDLARRLKLDRDALRVERANSQSWRAVRIELPDFVDETSLRWITRALESKLTGGKYNLVLLDINSSSGDPEACLQLARRLSAFSSEEIRTVAFINRQAAGPAGMLALSCQHVIMHEQATLGGPYSADIAADRLEDLKASAVGIAEAVERDPAILQAMLDPDMEVFRFADKAAPGTPRLLTLSQHAALDDPEQWEQLDLFDVVEPIAADTAERTGIARRLVSDLDELLIYYQLESSPELLKPTSVDRWLQQAGTFLASPFVAPWLLFGAMFFLFNEVSQPGLGIPGFLGTICLILYFWSQHLDGNANGLEILLFLAGVIFLGIEFFVLPGFGVFGIGGLLMVVASIVLASQTFVFPTTTAELRQLPRSVFVLAGAAGGLVFAMVLLRTVLPRTPFFKKIMLEPPTKNDPMWPAAADPESMVSWEHLVGESGEAVTPLLPSGKAKIAGRLINVISDGRMIEKGQAIVVAEVAGNRVVVVADEKSA